MMKCKELTPMSQVLDPQRAAVYKACQAWTHHHMDILPSLQAVQEFVDSIQDSPWWTDRMVGAKRVTVVQGSELITSTMRWDTGVMEVGRHEKMRSEGHAIHEMAHHLVRHHHGWRVAAHGPAFALAMVYVTQMVKGERAAGLLRAYFLREGVKYAPVLKLAKSKLRRKAA